MFCFPCIGFTVLLYVHDLVLQFSPSIKEGVLQALIREPESSVRSAIAQFVGVIARHELHAGNWPALLQFIEQMVQSQNVQEKQVMIN